MKAEEFDENFDNGEDILICLNIGKNMTLPEERTRSIAQTRKFLVDLSFNLKRIPKEVREMAKGCLRHYPDVSHIQEMCEKCPEIMDMKTINSFIECLRWKGVDDGVRLGKKIKKERKKK
jgi:hypothetical protein